MDTDNPTSPASGLHDVRIEYRAKGAKEGSPAVRVLTLSGLERDELVASFAADASATATLTLRCSHTHDDEAGCDGTFQVQAWRVRSIVALPGGEVLYERRRSVNRVDGWYHTDGSRCPTALLPAGADDGKYWCTEHQQHLYAAPPAALVPARPRPATTPLNLDDAHAVLGGELEQLLANAAGRDALAPGALMVQAFKETGDELGALVVSQVMSLFLMRLQAAAALYDATPDSRGPSA